MEHIIYHLRGPSTQEEKNRSGNTDTEEELTDEKEENFQTSYIRDSKNISEKTNEEFYDAKNELIEQGEKKQKEILDGGAKNQEKVEIEKLEEKIDISMQKNYHEYSQVLEKKSGERIPLHTHTEPTTAP
ncbi:hypothetical protein AYI68_g7069 [Smittium mucronatum]|uniref:Uncharacterized protein n=1 Tax=Smittium mucronatum TaxID=133383 RepID=A0A1R0GPQ2_9FUNG|nr:hypothetical protein AYI68_g7069 [Smittium mucronatum]